MPHKPIENLTSTLHKTHYLASSWLEETPTTTNHIEEAIAGEDPNCNENSRQNGGDGDKMDSDNNDVGVLTERDATSGS